MLWAHAQAAQQPHRLRTLNRQQILARYARAVQPLGRLDDWQPYWVVCQQHAAAVAGKLLEVAPHQLAIQVLQLHQLLALVPAGRERPSIR